MAYGHYEAYALGFTTRELNKDHNLSKVSDKITKIYGSPAKENLKLGDKIISLDGKAIADYSGDGHKPSTINLVIERNGKRLDFTLTREFQKVEITKRKDL